MTLRTLFAAGAILLSATTLSLAQSQPNCGPNAPTGDTFGTVPTGTYGAQRGAARCQARNVHAYRHHHRHYRHHHYSERQPIAPIADGTRRNRAARRYPACQASASFVRELRLLEGTCDEKRKRSAATERPTPRKPALALLRDPRLKKIYVYSEGTFVLHNAAEIKKLGIKTPAFDVSGQLDLSQMRPGGDTVETEVHVSFANRSNVGYGKWQWSGPKLLALGDMTNLPNYLSGTQIQICVQQTTSFDNFAKPVEYAYQFVVESQ